MINKILKFKLKPEVSDPSSVENEIKTEMNNAGRFVKIIFVLAKIAPLMGLLGTVGGMITTFDVFDNIDDLSMGKAHFYQS